MDYDSSSKFISSLAKFLQSLCNGYVEFDNGVEVIGHIYLSVDTGKDTGKTIDYVLNEKVRKTDENSVTFISNSFHAQPAEKPKPNSRKGKTDIDDKSLDVVEINNSIQTNVEPKSTNTGTIPQNLSRNLHSPSHSHHQRKRPSSPRSKHFGSPSAKINKNNDLEDQDNAGISVSFDNQVLDPLRGVSSFPSDQSNSNFSHDNGYNQTSDATQDTEERDIKPSFDTDVTFVKEEYTSNSQIEDEGNQDNISFSSIYHTNESYGGGGSTDQYEQQQSSFIGTGESSDLYNPGMGSSPFEKNDGGGSQSAVWSRTYGPRQMHLGVQRSQDSFYVFENHHHVFGCEACGRRYKHRSDLTRHRWKCLGLRVMKCIHCNAEFHRKDHLKHHMMRLHFGM